MYNKNIVILQLQTYKPNYKQNDSFFQYHNEQESVAVIVGLIPIKIPIMCFWQQQSDPKRSRP